MISLDMTNKFEKVGISLEHFTLENNMMVLPISVGDYDLNGKFVTAVFSPKNVETAMLTVDDGMIMLPIYASEIQEGINAVQLTFRWGESSVEQSPIMLWKIEASLPATGPAEEDVGIMTSLIAQCQALLSAEALRVSAEGSRVIAEEDRDTAEGLRETAEGLRKAAETGRVTAEGLRAGAESSRVTVEESRVTAEGLRVGAEHDRDIAEGDREYAEGLREQGESARVSAEGLRNTAEQARLIAEGDATSGRVKAELEREASEQDRTEAESLRYSAESKRNTDESARSTAEGLRVASEVSRVTEEGKRTVAESSRVSVEVGRVTAEGLRVSAEQARVLAEGDVTQGRVKAEIDRVTAESARLAAEIARQKIANPFKQLVHSGLTFSYDVGIVRKGIVVTHTPAGSVMLTDNAVNCICVSSTGEIKVALDTYEQGYVPMYTVTTLDGSITNVQDDRSFINAGGGGDAFQPVALIIGTVPYDIPFVSTTII